MTEIDQASADPKAKRKKSRAIPIALVLALLLGGGGFYAAYSGLIPIGGGEEGSGDAGHADAGGGQGDGHAPGASDGAHGAGFAQPAYVALDPLVVSLGETANARHLKIGVTVEVVPGTEADVAAVIPRINDVLNTYLRAVDERDLQEPRAMSRLRAHMLRRVRLVSPPDAVRDLLVQEFVLN